MKALEDNDTERIAFFEKYDNPERDIVLFKNGGGAWGPSIFDEPINAKEEAIILGFEDLRERYSKKINSEHSNDAEIKHCKKLFKLAEEAITNVNHVQLTLF